jgi:hypothetical protein
MTVLTGCPDCASVRNVTAALLTHKQEELACWRVAAITGWLLALAVMLVAMFVHL